MDSSLRRRRSPADRADSVREEAEQFLALPDVGLTGQASEGVVANPFWSERARAEQELQLARPRGLDEAGQANVGSAASSSTELRPVGTGTEVMATEMGVAIAGGQVENGSAAADLNVSREVTEEGASQGPVRVAAAAPTMAPASSHPQEAEEFHHQGDARSSERLGMRPGERLIMEEMKNLIVGLYEQNQQLVEGQKALQRRVETMENEAMQSASSGGDGRDVGTLGVLGKGDKSSGEPEVGWVPECAPYLGRFIPPEERVSIVSTGQGLKRVFAERLRQLLAGRDWR